MIYQDFIELPFVREAKPPAGHDNCDQYPESLPRYFIETYTKPGNKVFDPFLGFGTTAHVAEELGRIPYGMEADGARFAWAAGQLAHWQNIKHGDSADLAEHNFPKMDFCITSPPYMPNHHKWNPLYGGHPGYSGYDTYLSRLEYIFKQVKRVMKRNALVIVQADNLMRKRCPYTPLVRDISLAVSDSFRPEAEIIVKWTEPQEDYTHTHCLVFKNV